MDGRRIPPPRRHSYLVLNKPRGVVCTMDDPEGRETIANVMGGWDVHTGILADILGGAEPRTMPCSRRNSREF